MTFKKLGNVYVLRLFKGEEIIGTITSFLEKENIGGGRIFGIGALKDVVLGYFDVSKEEYLKKKFEESFELLNLAGNISQVEGKPFAHIHVLLGKGDYGVIGGHLFEGIVSVTCEIFVDVYPPIKREFDSDTKLNLLSL